MKSAKGGNRNAAIIAQFVVFTAFLLSGSLWPAGTAGAQDDVVKVVEEKRIELKAREDALKKEEERLNILKKDVDEKIAKYTKLLNQVDAALKRAEQIQNERLLNMAKLYEAMPPEAAAAQLSAMDTDAAAQIMLRMKSKKAGAVVALLKPQKAVTLTKKMTSLQIKQ